MSIKLNSEFGLPMQIRWFTRRDLPFVLEIERDCFEHPWSYDDFMLCLQKWHCIGLVAEAGCKIIGYAIYEFQRSQLHLRNFAVGKDQRRAGVGSEMLRVLFDRLSFDVRSRITVEVRESNLGAQLFFKSRGFKAVSLRRNAHESGDDLYLMQYEYQPASQCDAGSARPEWKIAIALRNALTAASIFS